MTTHLFLVAAAAVLAGAVASVSGFGIGSLLTPLIGIRLGTKLAVAVVSIPHFVATGLRLWLLRRHIDRRLLLSFGLMSAAGGLAGALLHTYADSPALTVVFGLLLIFTGLMGLTGASARLRFHGWKAWAAGAVSGMLGGMVGNQGGIRSAAMLGFDVPRQSFVATATAVGVIVDLARMPVYLANHWDAVLAEWPVVVTATAGAVVGTLLGAKLLRRIPEALYRRLVSLLLVALGIYMLARVVN